MTNKSLILSSLLFLTACNATPDTAPPDTFVKAEKVPDRPTDVADPMAAVIWTLNYDLRQFDTVWTWLHTDVPAGSARSRAIAAAALIAVAELDRPALLDEGVAAFDLAIPAFPDDGRLPLWRAYLLFAKARLAKDEAATLTALDGIRATTKAYPAFTLFGLTLAVGGWADAPPALIEEARKAFETVAAETNSLDQFHSRRILDTPIAPYNVPAMQAMIGDLALRAGKKDEAVVAYYTGLNSNFASRWPWRAEVERRMKNADAVMMGLNARPATETSIGSQQVGAMGVTSAKSDSRFSGRIGNGSCTVCHTHVSTFDLNEPAAEIGWVKVKALPIAGAPNAAPIGFLLPDGPNPIPGGFAIGPYVDTAAPRDFFNRDGLYDGTMMIPAPPGTYFVAVQSDVGPQKYQGYSAKEFGMQRFVQVTAGRVVDMSGLPITLTPLVE